MLRLRRMTTADAPTVLRLNETARPEVTHLGADELFDYLTLSDLHLVAEREDGDVAAYLLAFTDWSAYDGQEFLAFRSMIAHPFVYVDQIVVSTGDRRRGLGRALYAEAEAQARRDGLNLLCCEVNTSPPNPASTAFHLRLGFEGRGALRTDDGRTVELMVKRLRDYEAS